MQVASMTQPSPTTKRYFEAERACLSPLLAPRFLSFGIAVKMVVPDLAKELFLVICEEREALIPEIENGQNENTAAATKNHNP
jgi:hypothetical protein